MLSHDLDGLILRIGNITNRSTDGKFQPNASENAFANRLKAFLELKCVPNYLKDIYVEFSPVDNVAEAVCKSIAYSKSFNVLHIFNSNHIYMKDLVAMIPDNQLQFAEDSYFDKKLNAFMKKSNNSNAISYLVNDFDKEKHLHYDNRIKIKNSFTNYFLEKISFSWNPIDKNYITNLLDNL